MRTRAKKEEHLLLVLVMTRGQELAAGLRTTLTPVPYQKTEECEREGEREVEGSLFPYTGPHTNTFRYLQREDRRDRSMLSVVSQFSLFSLFSRLGC